MKNDAQNDGDNIIFVLCGAEKTLHSHELESYNGDSGQLTAWIKIPTLSTNKDTEFYMYYRNPTCENQEIPEDVWDANYVMSQHLQETSGDHIDSTGLGNNGINFGSTQDAIGKIDGANSFDGVDDYIEVAHSDSFIITDAISIEGWFKLSSLYDKNPMPIVQYMSLLIFEF